MRSWIVGFATGLLVLATGAYAEEESVIKKGQFYLSPGIVAYEGPDDRDIGHDGVDFDLGGIVGYSFADKWAVEFLLSEVESDFENRFGRGEADVSLRWVDLVYKMKAQDGWQPFALFGGGRTHYDFNRTRGGSRDNQFNVGVGAFVPLTERILVRGDIRGVSSKKGGINSFLFLGLTGLIGDGSDPTPPPDSDGDGVPNDDDQCPTTPPGRVVDERGCELDSDGDGVVDGDDDCPGTPAGMEVDSSGCPRDSDGDGVPDYQDECPDSARGARVDEKGCYIELEEEVTIDMSIEFDTDKAQIRDDHVPELNRAIDFLRQYPTTQAVIEGHTDSTASEAYNQALSERRAKAVYDYMVDEADIDAGRLSHEGFGESRPIATNDTAEGRQKNRRVTAVVSGTHKVRQ